MYFLQELYRSQLFNILLRYSPFESEAGRRSTLINSGLYPLTLQMKTGEGQSDFVNWLSSELTKNLVSGKSEDLWCVKVFSHMITFPVNLDEGDKHTLEVAIEACKNEHKVCCNLTAHSIPEFTQFVPKQKLPRAPRQRTRPHSDVLPNQNLRETIVTWYDLKPVIERFEQIIASEQACAFISEHKEDLLRDYIFKRAEKMLQKQTKSIPVPFTISLYQGSHSVARPLETIIEEELMRVYGCKTLKELFVVKHFKNHIKCTIWNRYLPAEDMHYAATVFWQKTKELMFPYLQEHAEHRLRFVLFLAHLPSDGMQPLADFTSLQLPQNFAIKEVLFPWVESHLMGINVAEDEIDLYLRRLDNPDAQPFEIFGELRHIADEVQENYNQGKYNRRRSRV